MAAMQRMKVATEKHDKKIFKRGNVPVSPVSLQQNDCSNNS